MTRFMFVTWPGAGNQGPGIGVATALRAAGHQVAFAGYAAQAERFESLGFAFRVLSGADRLWPVRPPQDWMPVLVDAVWACREHFEDLPRLLADEPADDSRPLVVAGFSTGPAWDQTSRVRRTLDALDDGRHRLLVTAPERHWQPPCSANST
jgi:hypothetical protein